MKKVTIALMTMILMLSLACKEEKKVAEPSNQEPAIEKQSKDMAAASFDDESTYALFKEYQKLRVALVETAPDKAKVAAEEMKAAVGESFTEISTLADEISKAGDVEKQREQFSQLTEKVEPIFKGSIEGGEIYKQFCPMAFEGKGGYWISDASEIRNPYYGDKMLTCGKVTETIQ
ncbi:DUF3347 domain-containing protein [Maribacter sp. 4G9]|uniref:DUF3347 domain-containing protein n=1 Tax=Maribacter sp. 4G9 TaxID=1889777 RepID=UPI000C155118|nr:DUF3347 domain-containing protein [Maribacter sp. 4G9]PIB28961.1 hypothetical protein BFP75_03995 [Maribacter sp. 4G9]